MSIKLSLYVSLLWQSFFIGIEKVIYMSVFSPKHLKSTSNSLAFDDKIVVIVRTVVNNYKNILLVFYMLNCRFYEQHQRNDKDL